MIGNAMKIFRMQKKNISFGQFCPPAAPEAAGEPENIESQSTEPPKEPLLGLICEAAARCLRSPSRFGALRARLTEQPYNFFGVS